MDFIDVRQKLNLKVMKDMEEPEYNGMLEDAYVNIRLGIYTREDIANVNGDVIIDKDTLVDILTIDENGVSSQNYDLPLGKYYIKEINTNENYLINENEYDFEFKPNDNTTPVIDVILSNTIDKDLNEMLFNEEILYYIIGKFIDEYDIKITKSVLIIASSIKKRALFNARVKAEELGAKTLTLSDVKGYADMIIKDSINVINYINDESVALNELLTYDKSNESQKDFVDNYDEELTKIDNQVKQQEINSSKATYSMNMALKELGTDADPNLIRKRSLEILNEIKDADLNSFSGNHK